ncbi:MAG: isoleucine--tRNA ligase [Candidatus Micrarchaeaceae archaeon]|jgi:isoleucyl-tRNA synthetase
MLDMNSREQEVLKYWEENNTNEKVKQKNSNGKKFYFLDGPPYVTGDLAAHHIWVETIKDLVLRYKRYKGYNVHDRAGFDVHGLPIEVKVEKILNVTSKIDIEQRIGIENFVISCKDYAKEQSRSAISTFIRFGSSLDFNTVYMPYENYYISKGWHIFKEIHRKKLLYKGLTPLAYCPRCETVLSAQGPEVEYEDETDASIFVRFKIDKQKSKNAKINIPDNTYLVVWTTTPWTLPSNIAIAVNPKELYVIMRSGSDHYILAKERLDSFVEAANMSSVLNAEFYGSELKDVYYLSPLEKEVPIQKKFANAHRVLLSESFVTVSEGTGVLHVAPGHGPEDYKLGIQNKLPIFSPIDQHAHYTEEAGSFKGLKVPKEANEAVLAKLKENGSILFQGTIRHSYPHCWRCHSKLIYRATEQWFVNVQKIKKKMLSENRKVIWHPANAIDWFADAVESSPDWCVSRQRYWGAPLPIWVCDSCKEMEVIGSSKELKERAMLNEELFDLHRPYVDKVTFKCRKCSNEMHRVKDIFDVWYDSGISHTASLSDEEFKKLFPADWITESRDQIRGWFTVLLRTSVAVYGKSSFKRVNIGGMIKDELGQEMHRHLGNTISAQELLGITTADGYRLWCASHPRWLELKLKKQELNEADSNLMTLYNISQLVKELAQLSANDLKSVKKPSLSKLEKEELWILSRLNTLIESTTANMDNYYVDVAVNDIKFFILEDFSRFYLKFAKQRAETANKSQLKKLSNITAYVLHQTLIMASVITPFVCENIYQELFSTNKKSIFESEWPKSSKKLINAELENDFKVLKETANAILYLREQKNVKLRWPIQEAMVETNDAHAIGSLERVNNLLSMYVNAKSIKTIQGKASRKEIKPIFHKLGPIFKQNAQEVADELKKQDADEVESAIEQHGHYMLNTSKGTFEIKAEQFTILEKASSEAGTTAKAGNSELYISINSEMTIELKEELMAREFIRRIQMMRKEMNLTRMDNIIVYANVDNEMKELLQKNKIQIKQVVKAKDIKINHEIPGESFKKDWDILGAKLEIGLSKA